MEAATPRPHPRFAGADVLIAHGVEMVQEGMSSGKVCLVVGGVFLILLGVVLVVGWRYRHALLAWIRERRPSPSPSPEEGGEGSVGGVPLQERLSHEGPLEDGGQQPAPSPLLAIADVHVDGVFEPVTVSYGTPTTRSTFL